MHLCESLTDQTKHSIWEVGQAESEVHWPIRGVEAVGEVANELALPPNLSVVHPVFHVSMLKKCVLDGSHKKQYRELDVQLDIS